MQRLFDEALAAGPISLATLISHQGNNQLLDAENLAPFLLDAYTNATAPGAPPELTAIVSDPRVGAAIGRIAAWDFSTPTGINEGWDPSDPLGVPGPPAAGEIDASVAATLYSMWRGQLVQRVIDTTLATLPIPLIEFTPGDSQAMSALRRLLEQYPINGGTGASLINFFNVPGVADQDVARDVILLGSLVNALDLLASDEFAPAFENSTNLDDYRWGKLHRIVFEHPLSPLLSIPPAGSPLNLAPDLPGFARAGGMGAVDASSHSARADGLHEFMFDAGPSRRLIATMTPDGPSMLEVIPGGQSGIPGSPHQSDQLMFWLANEYKPVWVDVDDAIANAVATEDLVCGDGIVTVGEECDDGNANPRDGCAECMIVPLNPFFEIKPGSSIADINPYSLGLIPMVVFGADFFDVTQVDIDTVRFGPFGAVRAHSVVHLDDENLDGLMDLTFHFWTRETGIQCFDTEATISGTMLDGTPFESTDSINTVGCREPEQPNPAQDPETVVTPTSEEDDVFGDSK
jgi:cysteine-rich repeat protein